MPVDGLYPITARESCARPKFPAPLIFHFLHPTFGRVQPDIMTEPNPVQEAEASLANLLLDDVTGEKVSKSELKRRQKLREKEAKKQEKAAAAPQKTEKKTSAEDDEANLTPNVGANSEITRR